MSIFLTIGVLGALLGGGFLLTKAPSLSTNNVSRETMIENIKEEYSTFEDIDNSLIPNIEEKKDIFSKPLGVDRKKDRLDMLFSDVSTGIKKGSSNNDDEERSKDKKKKSFLGFLSSFFSSLFSFLVNIKELVFLLLLLLFLILGVRKPSKKKNN